MKAIYVLIGLIVFIFSFNAKAQLKGKGPVLKKEFSVKDFNKLKIEDFDGEIIVEIGKPYAIKIEIDENLEPRLKVKKDEDVLLVFLEGNTNGKLYLEDTRIKIYISMPEASIISHRGNTNIKVTGIDGRYFKYENTGNGDASLTGKIDQLDVKKMGNGSVFASNLIAKTAKVKSLGNGNVSVNAQISLQGSGMGNGSILQSGTGQIEPMSGVVGNGNVRRI
jgi:hypothetical protein